MNLLLSLIILLVIVIDLSKSFNLNTYHAIIYADAHLEMRIATATKSFFGFTTVLYPGDEANRIKPRIFIGAPKGTDPSGLSENPGVVFKCGIKQRCEIMKLDEENGRSSYGNEQYTDCKDNAWIGGSMDINVHANLVNICGFRWSNIYSTNEKSMIGVCYLADVHTNSENFTKLLPLLDSGKATWSSKGASVYLYYLGQAGFSSHITRSINEPQLLLGAPGILNWYGGNVLFSNLSSGVFRYQSKVAKQSTHKFALFGYAVTSGRFNDIDKILYVSSSPKGTNYLGDVLLYKFPPQPDHGVEIQYALHGSQVGESFGAALAAGDLNNDKYDDLIVGAPHYTNADFNDGRVHVFYGGKEFNDYDVTHLTGNYNRGQFGAAISFLGDLNLDGYGDIAVGAPYSDNGRGVVYIFHGSRNGIVTTPAQILEAQSIDYNLRGFGISISNAADIDNNGFRDIAIGSHLSGHTVLVRSNPIVKIETTLQLMNVTKINVGNTEILYCYTHTGSEFMSKHINVRRTLTIDEHYKRMILAPPTELVRTFILKNGCEIFMLTTIKEKLHNIIEPVKISVSYELVKEPERKSNYYVGINNTDTFCKTCPILSNTRPHESEFSFALGCDGDICVSDLNFAAKFSHVSEDNWFVIGSTDEMTMEIQVTNSRDKAYLTQVYLYLPLYVTFNSIPKKCSEEEQGTLICLVGNPLIRFEHISVGINMKDVRTDLTDRLLFEILVTTSSVNMNMKNTEIFTIKLKNEVDLVLLGKSVPPRTFYKDNATFIHLYEIQKNGDSPAEHVELTINMPTHIKLANNESLSIVKFYSIMGTLSGQPILCKNHSEIDYMRETSLDPLVESDTDEYIDSAVLLRRRRRALAPGIVYSNNLNVTTTEEPDDDAEFISNYIVNSKGVSLDCIDSTNTCVCARFTCYFRMIKSKEDVGVVRIKAFLETTLIKEMLENTEDIFLHAYARVDAAYETNFDNNNAIISSIFVEEKEFIVALWVYVIASVSGLLLLMLITFILYKAGFFARTKKIQMEQEKRLVALEEFSNARLSGEPGPDYVEEEVECAEEVKPVEK